MSEREIIFLSGWIVYGLAAHYGLYVCLKLRRRIKELKQTESQLKEMSKYCQDRLSYYNATPDEWDHHNSIMGID